MVLKTLFNTIKVQKENGGCDFGLLFPPATQNLPLLRKMNQSPKRAFHFFHLFFKDKKILKNYETWLLFFYFQKSPGLANLI